MRIARRAALAALAISAIVTSVAAANTETIAPGTFEFTPTLAFSRTSFTVPGINENASITHFDLNATVARSFTEQFQLMGGLLVQHHAGTGEDLTSYGGSVGAMLNLPVQGSVIPFASLQMGFVQYTGSESDRAMLAPMMRLGVRSWIADQRTLNVSLGYRHEINPESSVRDDANVFDIGVGVSMMKK